MLSHEPREGHIVHRSVSVLLTIAVALGSIFVVNVPEVYACYTWQVGNRVGLKGGAEIRHGPGFGYGVHTIVPHDNWQVDIIDGPRYADGQEWWDISRKNLDGGGTGWVYIAQAGYDRCGNEPGRLEPVDDLSLWSDGSGAWPPQVGDKLIAHIKVRNAGDQSLHVEHIGVKGRRNGSENWDIGWWTIDLEGHQEWSLDPNNERPLQEGSYCFRISYSLDGSTWIEISNKICFNVSPSHLYSISGHVRDGSGNPTSGVTISDGAGHAATTDSNGNYTLSGLVAGNYTITPSKSGYTFLPPSHSVAVPPDATGKDFMASPAPLDIGFQPNRDGYWFPNYVGHYPLPPAEYSIEEAILMFGEDAVCSWIVAGVCFPKRDIQRWIHLVNLELNGGHCNGMTITSLRLFKELDSHPGELDTYSLGKNDQILATWDGTAHSFTVRRYISYFQVLQYTDSVSKEINDALFLKTPKEVLERLRSAMLSKERDFTTLVMYSERPNTPETPGHAVTPYRIEDKGNGVYWVWVYDSNRPYDNNRPNESNRYVEINTTNNTWSYNWDRDCTWNGDADSHSLGALPISVYDKRPNGWSFEKLQTWLEGQGHLLITDSRGRRVGYIDDHFVDEVPEAFGIVHPRYTDTPSEPIYYLPINETYTILVDGRTLTQTETVAVTQFGPGYAASVDDVKLEPTSQNWLTIAPDGTQLVYQSSDHGEATLTLALDSASESNQFQIRDADIGVGQSVVLTVDTSNGQLVFDNSQAGGGLYDLEIARVSAAGEQKFSYAGVVISPVDTHYVDYGAWDGSGPMMLHIDHGSDGTVDEVVTLQAKISVSLAETSMRVGEVAETQIMVSNVTDFYGADFTITFNPTVVQVEDADPHMPGVQIAVGALFDGQDHFVARNWVDNAAGVIEFVASLRDPAPPINGSGAVAAITWQGVNPGISDLVLEQVNLSDRGSNPIDHSRENGTIEVTDGTGSLISGTVLLQGRTDHSGTVVFATEGLCPDLVHVTDVAIPIPGLPSTATDVEGRFEITPYPGQTYQCLQAVQGGYLVAQASSPTGNLGMLTLPGGDVTGDDVINIFDLALVAARYGSDDPNADVNADGQVGIFDLTITAGNYGRRGPVTDWQWGVRST